MSTATRSPITLWTVERVGCRIGMSDRGSVVPTRCTSDERAATVHGPAARVGVTLGVQGHPFGRASHAGDPVEVNISNADWQGEHHGDPLTPRTCRTIRTGDVSLYQVSDEPDRTQRPESARLPASAHD